MKVSRAYVIFKDDLDGTRFYWMDPKDCRPNNPIRWSNRLVDASIVYRNDAEEMTDNDKELSMQTFAEALLEEFERRLQNS